MVQQIGSGTAASMEVQAMGEGVSPSAATVTGAAGLFAGGTGRSGCVLAIFTVGGGGAGSGNMVMRAVSFTGPACVPEPG